MKPPVDEAKGKLLLSFDDWIHDTASSDFIGGSGGGKSDSDSSEDTLNLW